ncbi:MAG: 50S ribosomal protein L25 [Roseiflexus sp.]
MSEKFTLSLEARSVLGKKVKRLRRSGILPATVYGKGIEPVAVQVNARSFQAIYRQAGRTSLIELHIAGHPPLAAFIHALQRHPVTRDIIHADVRVVDLRQEVEVVIPLHIEGESPLVESGEAVRTRRERNDVSMVSSPLCASRARWTVSFETIPTMAAKEEHVQRERTFRKTVERSRSS